MWYDIILLESSSGYLTHATSSSSLNAKNRIKENRKEKRNEEKLSPLPAILTSLIIL